MYVILCNVKSRRVGQAITCDRCHFGNIQLQVQPQPPPLTPLILPLSSLHHTRHLVPLTQFSQHMASVLPYTKQ